MDPCEEKDETNVCRCICGDNDPTANRPWIRCNGCRVWQHNDCMNVSYLDDELGDYYQCEECGPGLHKELLAAGERGETPWEVRYAKRLQAKARFESEVKAALEWVEWLWELYEAQSSADAGGGGALSARKPPPSRYVRAVRAGLDVLFEDLSMQSLKDLARQLDASEGIRSVMKVLRKKAAAEHEEGDMHALGILAELFGWLEKGTVYSQRAADAASAEA